MAVRVITEPTRPGDAQAAYDRELARVSDGATLAIKIIFGLFSFVLALAALFVVLGHNVSSDNPLVKACWNFADVIDGPFSKDDGIFRFHGAKGAKLDAVVNWGCAALAYLLAGNLFRFLLHLRRPRRPSQ